VDGLFFSTTAFTYQLQVRYRSHATAKLMQVNINTGEEKQLVLFDSTHFPSTSGFQLQRAAAPMDSAFLDAFARSG
jgi:hypothetical protein